MGKWTFASILCISIAVPLAIAAWRLPAISAFGAGKAVVVVAAADSGVSRLGVDFLCDGIDDQLEIQAAIDTLPAAGGKVRLLAGHYDLRAGSERAAVTIRRSNVTIEGAGSASTRLRLADDQNVNGFLITGEGTSHVTITGIHLDGNRSHNTRGPLDRFDASGIRGDSASQHDITVASSHIENWDALNVYAWGDRARILDNHLGNASADVAELCSGRWGEIRGNFVTISGPTGYALGTDEYQEARITNNTVHVTATGEIVNTVFRLWKGRSRNTLADNHVSAEAGARIATLAEVGGYLNIVTNNVFSPAHPSTIVLGGGATLFSRNIVQAATVIVDATSHWPILVEDNLMFDGSALEIARGNVIENGNTRFDPAPEPDPVELEATR